MFSVEVEDVPPMIQLLGNASVNEGSPYTLNLGTITDPGGSTVSKWIVNWGDGKTSIYNRAGEVSHVYADGPSMPTITVDLKDQVGTHRAAGSLSLTVQNTAPVASLSAAGPVTYGQTVDVFFTAPYDPSPADRTAGFRYSFAFDIAELAESYSEAAQSDTWPIIGLAAGTYQVYGRIFDQHDAYTTRSTTATVQKAPLTVTADGKTKVYGAADPELTYTASGDLFYGDSYDVISGMTISTVKGAAATAGTHTITASGGIAANYAITHVAGTLTVSQASLTVTADRKTKVYGAADPALTYTASGELFHGDQDTVITGVTLATATGAAATAGTHTITASGGTAANYAIAHVGGTLTVSQASLTVTAASKTKVYGAADPALTCTASGTLFYGDQDTVITGVTLATATGAAATAGTHMITTSGGTAHNYAITHVPGTLTVTPASCTPWTAKWNCGRFCWTTITPRG